MQDFKHIKVWQRAHVMSIAVHKRAVGWSRRGHGNLPVEIRKIIYAYRKKVLNSKRGPA